MNSALKRVLGVISILHNTGVIEGNLMKPKPWSMSNAFIYGAVFGAIYIAIKLTIDPVATRPAEMVGMGVGGAIGGAMLFGLIAWIRNLAGGAR